MCAFDDESIEHCVCFIYCVFMTVPGAMLVV